ncbi:MAG: NFACT RNA binding domain-containing protein [Treponematales bacterium]
MSLNWKEINLVLEELRLPGSQIQKAVQSAYDVLALHLHGRDGARTLLVSLSPGSCRLHETFRPAPKPERPLRFAQFLNSRLVNGWIEDAAQLGADRVVRLLVRRGENRYRLYARLWSNAANVIVTDEAGNILDAMRRLPKRGEVSGGRYVPEAALSGAAGGNGRDYEVRRFEGAAGASFNEKVDAFYAAEGGALSLEALQAEARRVHEARAGRLAAALDRLRAKEAEYADAGRLREYGGIILANAAAVRPGDEWLEAEDFYAAPAAAPAGSPPPRVRIRLDPPGKAGAAAQSWFARYAKAKKGLGEVRAEIARGEGELARAEAALARLLAETNPLVLRKLLNRGRGGAAPPAREAAKRPGLAFRRRDWLLLVGRDAAENDALLRRHVKGGDLWLHARDVPGAYVFIKHRAGKTVPLDILLDAGNLALFYSKARNAGEGDLFYTQVKYLRRAKNGPKGLVIPTQEKNLHIKADPRRLRELEECRE